MNPTTPLETVPEAVLPLGFASDYDEAPFGAKGTCFLVRRNGVLWIVTAKHAVGDRTGYVRVPHNADSLKWMEFGATSTIDPYPGEEDSAYADLTVIRVLTEADDLARPIDLDDIAFTDEATTGDPIFMFGYPVNGLENSVEYNDDATTVHVHRQRCYLEALYERPDTSRYLQVMRIGLTGDITTLDGMSGGPVFLKHGLLFSFAGVLVRAGGGTFELARFIEGDILKQLLDRAWREEVRRGGPLPPGVTVYPP